jgi:hypothetical protein
LRVIWLAVDIYKHFTEIFGHVVDVLKECRVNESKFDVLGIQYLVEVVALILWLDWSGDLSGIVRAIKVLSTLLELLGK